MQLVSELSTLPSSISGSAGVCSWGHYSRLMAIASGALDLLVAKELSPLPLTSIKMVRFGAEGADKAHSGDKQSAVMSETARANKRRGEAMTLLKRVHQHTPDVSGA